MVKYTETGRSKALVEALRLLGDGPAHIIEVGGLRNASEAARWSDGWSTLTFAEHVACHGGSVVMVELLPRRDAIKRVLGDLMQHVSVHRSAAQARDSYDCDMLYLDGPNDGAPHLHAVQHTNAKVLAFDDCVREDYGPKAHTAIPWALENGYELYGGLGRVVILKRHE